MLEPEILMRLGNPLLPHRPPLAVRDGYLVCTETGVGFPIENGIPRLLRDRAVPADEMAAKIRERNP